MHRYGMSTAQLHVGQKGQMAVNLPRPHGVSVRGESGNDCSVVPSDVVGNVWSHLGCVCVAATLSASPNLSCQDAHELCHAQPGIDPASP